MALFTCTEPWNKIEESIEASDAKSAVLQFAASLRYGLHNIEVSTDGAEDQIIRVSVSQGTPVVSIVDSV